MKVLSKKIKLFGKAETLFQVVDSKGEVLQVLCSQSEAEEWIKNQK